jgi:ABC-type uncharacterized transport system permease subunit
MSPMLVFGILAFAIVMFFISFLIGKTNDSDKGKIATYVTMIAWSSLVFGLYMGRTIR